jgi:hypothetical protein
MQTITAPNGTKLEWDDTLKPGDLISLTYSPGFYELLKFNPHPAGAPVIPTVVCKQVYTKNGKKYTGPPFNILASYARRPDEALEKEITKHIQSAAVFNKILEDVKFKRSIDK